MKLRAAILLLALGTSARADLTIPGQPLGDPKGVLHPTLAPQLPSLPVPQEDDDEPTDPGSQARTQCAPLLRAATTALHRSGAIEISPVADGRSLIANFFLRGRQKRSASLNVEVRVDCMRKPRTDPTWSASDSYFERQQGRLQASFIIPPRSDANAYLPQVEQSLDRVLASSR